MPARPGLPRVKSRPKPASSIHALRVEMRGIRPAIYREILVRSDVKLATLHRVLQACFGWYDGHLHMFLSDDRRITNAAEVEPGDEDEARVRVRDVLPAARSKLAYLYDFGDGWEVIVKTVRIRDFAPGPGLPTALLVGGERRGPPEDCGGIPGYEELCAAIADPKHPDRASMLERFGDVGFDPGAFPRDEIEAELRHIR